MITWWLFIQPEQAKFLRKIPAGAEASNVLVGEVDFVEKPMVAFIRLNEGKVLSEITEVPIPTRFVFLLLGPPTTDKKKYREIGRCMATLMTDDVSYHWMQFLFWGGGVIDMCSFIQ